MPTILLRRGTSAEWAAVNPVLGAGELGVDLTQGKMKLGDGVSTWSVLSFMGGGGGGGNPNWGGITGVLNNQTDLQTALNGKANTVHTHTASQITDLSDNLRVFVQDTTPLAAGPYLWIDTTGGNLQFMVEDGL